MVDDDRVGVVPLLGLQEMQRLLSVVTLIPSSSRLFTVSERERNREREREGEREGEGEGKGEGEGEGGGEGEGEGEEE